MPQTLRRLAVGMVVLALVTTACGDDDAAATTTAATTTTAGTTVATAASTVPPARSELRFTFEGITGARGKILVGTVFAAGGEMVATVCQSVASDPFSGSAVAATAAPDNPCGHDAPFGEPLTVDGAYSYMVALHTGGSQAAEACAFGEVTVDGPTEIVVAAADLTVDNCNA